MLLTSDNQFTMGLVKLVLYENNIKFSYNSDGYVIKEDDFISNIDKFKTISYNLRAIRL
tara:strand:- start:1314 stop:1490 length:177 start_codon:yes stop_codon:yes gene_type:complete